MKKTLTTIAAATLVASSGMAMAEVELSGNVALTTDYVFRGISQTDSGPAIQGGFDAAFSNGLYAGIWASNLDFDDDADIEVDYYAGFGGEFANKLGYDVGVIYYDYPSSDAAKALDYDFTEVYGSLSYDFGPAAVSLGVNYSSDFFGDGTDDATYVALGVDIPLANDFALSLHYGDQSIDLDGGGDADYNDWKIGVSKSLGGFDFALDYTDTDLNDKTDCLDLNICDDRVIFTISKSL